MMWNKWKTPIVLQMENIECGAASLSIIANFYGFGIGLDEMRETMQVSRDGTSLKNIVDAAEKCHMDSDAQFSTIEKIVNGDVHLPCIVLWDQQHYIVVEHVSKNYFYLNDPAFGRIRLSKEAFEEKYSYVTISFKPKKDFVKKKKEKPELNYLINYLKEYRSTLLVLSSFALLITLITAALPLLGEVFIDYFIIKKIEYWIYALCGIVLFIAIGQFSLTLCTQFILRKLNFKLILTKNYKTIEHLLNLPISFFSFRNLGDLTTRVSANTTVATFFSQQMFGIISAIIQILIYGILLILLNYVIFLIVVILIIIDICFYLLNYNYTYEKSISMQMEYAKLSSVIESSLQSLKTIKATGQENVFFNRWNRLLRSYLDQLKFVQLQNLKISSFGQFLSQSKPIIIIAAGGFLVNRGILTIGELIAFSFLANYLFQSSTALFQSIFSWQSTKANITRLIDLEKTTIDTRYQGDFIPQSTLGKIEFKNISFGYNKNFPAFITDVSFSIEPGEWVALMGETGSGKSSMIKLLQRLYSPWSGEILIDDVPLQTYKIDALVKILASADQEPFIFQGTLKENLLLDDDDTSSDQDIVKYISQIGLFDLISKNNEGLDLLIQENGKNLSGGQAQLIEILRAILANPKILTLDEATSSLDYKNINNVMGILSKLFKSKMTVIMISHQTELVKYCDKVIVFKDGQIVDSGTHENLYQSNEYYKNIILKGE